VRDEILQSRPDRIVRRLGDRVRYPREPWTEATHALLAHLAEQGFTEAPRPLSLTADFEEQSFVEGVSGDPACLLVGSDSALAAVAQLLRRYHDAVADWAPAVPPRWYDGQSGTGGPDELIVHGDPGPWNLVWRDGELVGLIDWEYATVGTRRTDIAYALHFLAPFRDRSYWQGVLGMAQRPRRRHRMSVFADAYGITVDEALVDEVLASQQAGVRKIVDLAALGRRRQLDLIAAGELERENRAVDWSTQRRRKFLPRVQH
jgi:hypothetical protein